MSTILHLCADTGAYALLQEGQNKPAKHPNCKGYKFWTACGWEYDCEYPTTLVCDDCKYGGGSKDPESKCNTASNEL